MDIGRTVLQNYLPRHRRKSWLRELLASPIELGNPSSITGSSGQCWDCVSQVKVPGTLGPGRERDIKAGTAGDPCGWVLTLKRPRALGAPEDRLDAGTFGTMGVGLGFALAAALIAKDESPHQRVICIEGDSAFGFSSMEVETIC
eukprot:g36504.t1